MARNCISGSNNGTQNRGHSMVGSLMLGLVISNLLGLNRSGFRLPYRPREPYGPPCPYYGPRNRRTYFIGDFTDVREIENLP